MSLFPMNTRGKRVRFVQFGAVGLAAALAAGCGSTYRPVVTPINPSGPAAQPNSLAVVVSSPAPSPRLRASLLSSITPGDTIVASAPIGPGPLSFTLDATGSQRLHGQQRRHPDQLPGIEPVAGKILTFSTLPTNADTVGLFSPSAGLWVADQTGNVIDVLTGGPETFKLAIPVAPTPISIAGPGLSGTRFFSISLNSTGTTKRKCDSVHRYDLQHRTVDSNPNRRSGRARSLRRYRLRAPASGQVP